MKYILAVQRTLSFLLENILSWSAPRHLRWTSTASTVLLAWARQEQEQDGSLASGYVKIGGRPRLSTTTTTCRTWGDKYATWLVPAAIGTTAGTENTGYKIREHHGVARAGQDILGRLLVRHRHHPHRRLHLKVTCQVPRRSF